MFNKNLKVRHRSLRSLRSLPVGALRRGGPGGGLSPGPRRAIRAVVEMTTAGQGALGSGRQDAQAPLVFAGVVV